MIVSRYLALKMILIMVIVGVLIFIPVTLLLVKWNKEHLEEETMEQNSEIVILITRYLMLKNDRKGLAQVLRVMGKTEAIDTIRIYGEKGISFSSIKEEVGTSLDRKQAKCATCHESDPPLESIPGELPYQIMDSPDGYRILEVIERIPNSKSCSMTRCHPDPSEKKTLGMIEMQIPLEKTDHVIAMSRKRMITACVLAVVFLELIMGLFIWRLMHSRIGALTAGTKIVSEGDYNHRIKEMGKDEIGILSKSFNSMVEKIQQEKQKNALLMKNIQETVTTVTAAASQLTTVTAQQASGAAQQVSVVQEVASTSREIASTSQSIAENADEVSKNSDRTSEVCNAGKEYINSSITGMDRIHDQVEQVVGQIGNLAEHTQNIESVIEIIEDISEQTNLLSLNASLEAAGAGEFGSRFSVVAQEVRRLANRTLEATETIRILVKDIQDATKKVVVLGEDEEEVVATGIESVRELVKYFEDTLVMVEATKNSATEITLMTKQQSSAGQQMVTAISEVEDMAHQTEKGVSDLEAMVQELRAMSEQLKMLLENGNQ